jgi:hypothetical protein
LASTQSVSPDEIILCASAGKEYTVRDVMDGAFFRDELTPLWNEFLRRVKSQEHADELDLEPNDEAIERSAEDFRYRHDLITAEEMEQWLGARRLTLNDFSDYLVRQYWYATLGQEIEADNLEFTSAPLKLRELFTAELLFSGQLNRLNTQLMWRLAALAACEPAGLDAVGTAGEKELDRFKINAEELNARLIELSRDSQWFDQLCAMEDAYRHQCRALHDPATRQNQLNMVRIALTRFEAEVIELESKDAAREALLCVREDGMTMETVAAEGLYPYRRISCFQEDLPSELTQKFLAADVGDVLEPFARADGFELYRVIKKIEPQTDDPLVRQRIDERLAERWFSELARKYVEPRLASVVPVE